MRDYGGYRGRRYRARRQSTGWLIPAIAAAAAAAGCYALFRWFLPDWEVWWLVMPCLAAVSVLGGLIRALMRRGNFENFRRFLLVIYALLGVLYVWGLAESLLVNNESYSPVTGSMQWIPFARLAELIEAVIKGSGEPADVVRYIAVRLLIYMPFGYYCAVLLKEKLLLLRFPLIIALPAVVEVVQRVFLLGGTDIDDVILGIIGGILGVLVYCIVDGCCRAFTRMSLLEKA